MVKIKPKTKCCFYFMSKFMNICGNIFSTFDYLSVDFFTTVFNNMGIIRRQKIVKIM